MRIVESHVWPFRLVRGAGKRGVTSDMRALESLAGTSRARGGFMGGVESGGGRGHADALGRVLMGDRDIAARDVSDGMSRSPHDSTRTAPPRLAPPKTGPPPVPPPGRRA